MKYTEAISVMRDSTFFLRRWNFMRWTQRAIPLQKIITSFNLCMSSSFPR